MQRILAFLLCGLIGATSVAAKSEAEEDGGRFKCAVRYQDQVIPMYWFPGDQAYHLNGPDHFGVIVKEKTTDDKLEINIMEATEDEVWNKLIEVTQKSDISPDLQRKLKNLGRTRLTRAYVGLYKDFLHFEHRLGTDRNNFELSCMRKSQPNKNDKNSPRTVEAAKVREYDI